MSRIHIVDPKTAVGEARSLLDAVQAKLGVTPNFIRILANSPKALEGFLGLHGALGAASIDTATQERIALAVAESNACQYCVSAHTALGGGAGLSHEEMLLNRQGASADARAAGAVAFAAALNAQNGEVTPGQLAMARGAGLGDAELVEIIALVVLNIFTNFLGKASQVDIDFPRVALLGTSTRAAA